MESYPSFTALATLQVGVASSDGRLSVTQDYLIFEPLNKLVGFGPYHLARKDICRVRRNMLRKLSINNQVHAALEVLLTSGETYQFIVADTERWLRLLAVNRPTTELAQCAK